MNVPHAGHSRCGSDNALPSPDTRDLGSGWCGGSRGMDFGERSRSGWRHVASAGRADVRHRQVKPGLFFCLVHLSRGLEQPCLLARTAVQKNNYWYCELPGVWCLLLSKLRVTRTNMYARLRACCLFPCFGACSNATTARASHMGSVPVR